MLFYDMTWYKITSSARARCSGGAGLFVTGADSPESAAWANEHAQIIIIISSSSSIIIIIMIISIIIMILISSSIII